jgi:hypothetical protein
VAAALLLAEGGLRLVWGDSTLLPPIYDDASDGIGLRTGAGAEGRLHSGQRYSIEIDARGLRAPAPPAPVWLLIGDSLPFGLGVAGEETAAAVMSAAGLSAAAAGVPAYSIADALAHAAVLSPRGVVVLPNAVDDDRQGARRLSEDQAVVGGRLVRHSAPVWARRFYGSWLAGGQLPLALMRLVSLLYRGSAADLARPLWVTADDGGFLGWAAIGMLIRDFAEAHPEIVVRTVWVPLPAVAAPGREGAALSGRLAVRDGGWSDERAVDGLKAGLEGEVLWDLREVFRGRADAFLWGDTHLSPAGNALLAEQLVSRLGGRRGD